jgi:hypothetical protein
MGWDAQSAESQILLRLLPKKMALSRAARAVLIGCVSAFSAVAQNWISVGVKGGVPLTDPFADRTFHYVIGTVRNPFGPPSVLSQSTRSYSGSRYFVLGPTIEVRLPLGLAAEADALYRPMDLKIQPTTSLSSFLLGAPTFSSRIDTWEFSLLAKYRLPLPTIKPYLEAGPSFRAISASPAQHMSGTGFSVGIGVESSVGRFRITPGFRYTHWGRDGTYNTPYHAVTYPNQVEFLAGLATGPAAAGITPSTHAGWRKHLSLGVKGGLPFTTAFLSDEFGKVNYPPTTCDPFTPPATCTISNPTVQTYSASRNYLVGPMVQVHVLSGLSIEGDALYAPLSVAAPAAGSGLAGLLLLPSIKTYDSWQFPVLGIYKFRAPLMRPYLEAGPTFRSISSPLRDYLSNTGVTAGLGVEATAWKLRIAPEVRFVHWGNDALGAAPFYASRRNQAQFLLGLSY